MVDWSLAIKIFSFGLSSVFGSLVILIGAIYLFGKVVKSIENRSIKKV